MRIYTTGHFLSVCEPNTGRQYDDRGKLIATSRVTGRSRRMAKRKHARAVRRMPVTDQPQG